MIAARVLAGIFGVILLVGGCQLMNGGDDVKCETVGSTTYCDS